MYVASKLGHLLWFPIGGPSHTSSGWLSVGLCSVSTIRQFSVSLMKARRTVGPSCFGTRVSGMRLTCPAQLSCDLTVCASMLIVSACSRMRALVIRSCQWTPRIALSSTGSEYALLELFEHFNMATVGDPCLTAI